MRGTEGRPPSLVTTAAMLTVVYMAWGSSFLFNTIALREFAPFFLVATRCFLAAVFLQALLLWRAGTFYRYRRGDVRWLLVTGALMFVGGQGLITLAQLSVPTGAIAAIGAAIPLWITCIDSAVRRSWPASRTILGLLVGMVGIVWLCMPTDHPALPLGGACLALISGLCWAGASVISATTLRGIASLPKAIAHLVSGGTCAALVSLCLETAPCQAVVRLSLSGVLSIGFLALVSSGLAFLAYNWLLDRVPPGVAGSYGYVVPVVAVAIGTTLLEEILTFRLAASCALILAGVGLVFFGSWATAQPPVERRT